MLKKKNGFTVVELMVVIGMIGILAAASFSYSMRQAERWNLRQTVREVSATFHGIKQRASRQNLMHRIEFNSGGLATSFRDQNGVWQNLDRVELQGKVSFESLPADFWVNSRGMLVDPNTGQLVARNLVLRSPKGGAFDRIIIRLLPYGGVQIERQFI